MNAEILFVLKPETGFFAQNSVESNILNSFEGWISRNFTFNWNRQSFFRDCCGLCHLSGALSGHESARSSNVVGPKLLLPLVLRYRNSLFFQPKMIMSFERVKLWLQKSPTFSVIPAGTKNNILRHLLIEFFHNFCRIKGHIVVNENVVLRCRAESLKILVRSFRFKNQVVVSVHKVADDKVVFVFKGSFWFAEKKEICKIDISLFKFFKKWC